MWMFDASDANAAVRSVRCVPRDREHDAAGVADRHTRRPVPRRAAAAVSPDRRLEHDVENLRLRARRIDAVAARSAEVAAEVVRTSGHAADEGRARGEEARAVDVTPVAAAAARIGDLRAVPAAVRALVQDDVRSVRLDSRASADSVVTILRPRVAADA